MTRRSLPPLLALALLGCGAEARAPDAIEVESGAPVCEGGRAIPALSIRPDLGALGEQPNAIAPGPRALWIVESGSNTLSRVDPRDASIERDAIDLGDGRGPYDIAIAGERAWVTNYVASTVSELDLGRRSVAREFGAPGLENPSGVAAGAGLLFVSDVEFRGGEFGAGEVFVFEAASASHLGQIAAAAPNPQYLTWIERDRRLVVVSTGALSSEGGSFRQRGPGGVEIWTFGADPLAPERSFYPVDPERDASAGALGRAVDDAALGALWLASATSASVVALDPERGWIRGPTDPIRLPGASAGALTSIALGPTGLVWASSFNDDALWSVDPACGQAAYGPHPLGRAPGDVEGPLALAIHPAAPSDLYFAHSVAKRLGRVRISAP